ncbi:MAG: helix-turn-helix domain-containing protein [Syntrophomonadaceae bacterium]|jgi:cytoskeleton protein RodZ|nr:helix-turn-helix domain-containing protein [Syntrophomonadaceae bacterium]
MSFGEKLKEVREAKGYSLDYIEEETKIRKLYINALEQETFEVLPPRVYATGFVRRYSKFLGLNADEMVVEFQSRAYYNESIHEEVTQISQKEVDVGFPVLYRNILAGIVFFIIALWAGKLVLGYITGRMDIPDQQATVPPKVEEPVKQPSPPVPEVKRALVLIEARQDCWLNVVVDGETVFTKIIKAGDKQEFKGKESVYIKAGNAGGIDITFNGEKVEPIGKYGEVKEAEFKAKS